MDSGDSWWTLRCDTNLNKSFIVKVGPRIERPQ